MDRLLESYHQGTTMKEIFLFVKILNVRFEAIWRLFKRANPNSKMTHLEIHTYITLMLMESGDETRINQENYGKKML